MIVSYFREKTHTTLARNTGKKHLFTSYKLQVTNY